eukprot:Lankesteria_metandrocarpae@DN5210_c0_g1_i1.p1
MEPAQTPQRIPTAHTQQNLDAEVATLLMQLLDPATVKYATNGLKLLFQHPDALPALTRQLTGNPQAEIRQLSAILMRRQVLVSWSKLSAEQQTALKNDLMRQLVTEDVNTVTKVIAHVICSLSKLILSSWSVELLNFLQECAKSTKAIHREAAQIIFGAIADDASDSYFETIAAAVAKGLSDLESVAVRCAAIRALENLGVAADDPAHFACLHKLLQPLSVALDRALADSNEDLLFNGLEVLNDLLEHTNVLQTGDLRDISRFVLGVAARTDFSCSVRDAALQFIYIVAKLKSRVLTSDTLLKEVLLVVLPMVTESNNIGSLTEEDEDEDTASTIAVRCVDALALYLPSKVLYPLMMDAINPLWHNDDPRQVCAALTLVGVLAEGCSGPMKKELPKIIPYAQEKLSSTDDRVVSAAGMCVGQIAIQFEEAFEPWAAHLADCLVRALAVPTERTREKIAFALEMVCDTMDEADIAPRLPVLLPTLLDVMTNAESLTTKQSCLSAIAVVCAASDDKFAHYAERIFGILEEVTTKVSPQLYSLRSSATLCAATIVGRAPDNIVMKYRTNIVMNVLQGLRRLDDTSIRENSFSFFTALLPRITQELVPLLPDIFPWAIAAVLSDEGIEQVKDSGDGGVGKLLDDELGDGDDQDIQGLYVRTGFMDEKIAALRFIEKAFRYIIGAPTQEFTKRVVDVLLRGYMCVYSGVRSALPDVVAAVMYSSHLFYKPVNAEFIETPQMSAPSKHEDPQAPDPSWRYTPGLPTKSVLHPRVMDLWTKSLWPLLKDIISSDQDISVVGAGCRVLGSMLESLGPGLLQTSDAPSLTDADSPYGVATRTILGLLQGSHPCLKASAGLATESAARVANEEPLDDTVCLVEGLCKALGPQIQTFFKTLFQDLLNLAANRESIEFQCSGIGVYAEALLTMGADGGGVAFAEAILPHALRAVNDVDGNALLKQNAAYCLGVIFEVSPSTPGVTAATVPMLQALHAIVTLDQSDFTSKDRQMFDNAVAAIGRFIVYAAPAQGSADVSMAELVPLFLKALPLKEDQRETEAVMKTLLFLYHNENAKALLEHSIVDFLRVGIMTLAARHNDATTDLRQHFMNTIVNALRKLAADDSPILQQVRHAVSTDDSAVQFLSALQQK